MVVRKDKRNRKLLGSRHWGYGNIKNSRGAGDRGGVGKGNTKASWTWKVKHPELIGKTGFHPWNRKKLKEINLDEINKLVQSTNNKKIELKNYKVLSNGTMDSGITVKATKFSKKASEKIKAFNSNTETF